MTKGSKSEANIKNPEKITVYDDVKSLLIFVGVDQLVYRVKKADIRLLNKTKRFLLRRK